MALSYLVSVTGMSLGGLAILAMPCRIIQANLRKKRIDKCGETICLGKLQGPHYDLTIDDG